MYQFYLQWVSGSNSKTDLPQSKWKNIERSDPSDWTNTAVTKDHEDHDTGEQKVQNKWFFKFPD